MKQTTKFTIISIVMFVSSIALFAQCDDNLLISHTITELKKDKTFIFEYAKGCDPIDTVIEEVNDSGFHALCILFCEDNYLRIDINRLRGSWDFDSIGTGKDLCFTAENGKKIIVKFKPKK